MTFAWKFKGRRSIRIPEYDYSGPGYYFLTICVKNRECLFGDVVDGKMVLSRKGYLVRDAFQWLSRQYTYMHIDSFIVMPNHFHCIIQIKSRRGGSRTVPTRKNKILGRLIGAFKTVSTKRINIENGFPGTMIWQRNFYERIVWTDEGLDHTREYIRLNPARWNVDPKNPDRP